MSANLTAIGHVGQPGELKKTASGTDYLGFTMATSIWRPGANGAEGTETTTWWSVRIWGKAAERLAGKVAKGDLVEVRGVTGEETWTKQDNAIGRIMRITADAVRVHTRKATAPTGTSEAKATGGDDEPPF